MTESTIAKSTITDAHAAGVDMGRQLAAGFSGQPADAVIIFASPEFAYATLLSALRDTCNPKIIVGCSSAGEFTSAGPIEASACAIGIRSDEIIFSAGLGTQLRSDRRSAAQQMFSGFAGRSGEPHRYRCALVLTDALAGFAEDLMEQVTIFTGGAYQLFGGGAGDAARFERTHVFYGTEAYTDAAVALEFVSKKPLGIGVSHGWTPASQLLRVTEAYGMSLVSLNAVRAVDLFQHYAAATAQNFDIDDPMPFFLHNILGIETPAGYKLRVPLAIAAGGAILCAAEIPVGSKVYIMKASSGSASEAAAKAAEQAVEQLGGRRLAVALFFDCAATRLRLGQEFGLELAEVSKVLGDAPYAGCNTYGQIARVDGQFSGFHNCTAVVCAIPS